jgi:hypothetical protein
MRFIYLWSILTKKGEKYMELGEAGYWLRWMWLIRRTAIIERGAQVRCTGVDVVTDVSMTFWLVQVLELQ